MVREGLWDVPLIVESAQVFDTHHVALLVAAGASAVVPYLADEFSESLEPGGTEKARAAINAGLRKVLARMGVSTLASYRNSHLFEVVGLSEHLCVEVFEDAADFPGQKSLDDLLSDYLRMHKAAFSTIPTTCPIPACSVSAKARSFTPVRPKLSVASTPTSVHPARKRIPPLKN